MFYDNGKIMILLGIEIASAVDNLSSNTWSFSWPDTESLYLSASF